MPCLNFSSGQFCLLHTFAKFVTRVQSRRNHQIDVSSVKLHFHGASNQAFVRKIAKYAFSHNVQELAVVSFYYSPSRHEYPPCLFSSQSLKHFTLTYKYKTPCVTTETPWKFPSLTTLHLSYITLRDDNLFTNCVNLKNLTLERCRVEGPDVFDIITPQLSNLTLIDGSRCKVINVIAPQLENLTVVDCLIEYLNAPPGISSLCYKGRPPCQLSKDGFHCLNKVSICLSLYSPYKEEVACKTINMLHELHSARCLTLDEDIVESLSSFPALLSQHSSPFGNLECLSIDYREWNVFLDAYEVTMSSEVKNFLLENSPSATIIMNHPKVPSI